MPDPRSIAEIKTTGPDYLGWRGDLLAELALARLPRLTVHKRPEGRSSSIPYDFLVETAKGFCFYVLARAFSSFQLGIAHVERVGVLHWSLYADLIYRARESRSPILLFLFDADTDHGRFLRLDTLAVPRDKTGRLTVHLPVEQTINRENLEREVAALQKLAKS